MFKKMVLAVLGLMMALGVMSVSAATATADHGGPHGPGKSMSQENVLVVTVVKYGDRWEGPRVTIRTRSGHYVGTASQVGRQEYKNRTVYRYIARDLPWYRDLKVEVRGRGHYSGDDTVRFEKNFRDYRVTKEVVLVQQKWGGGWN